MTELIFSSNPWLLPALMLVVLGLSIEVPYRFGRSLARYMPKADPFSVVQTGLLTLAAFVLALSFNQASARFDTRRQLVIREANAIGTTWLRSNQLEATRSTRFRRILTDYTAARLKAYETPRDPELYRKTIDQGNKDQGELWSIVSSALRAHQTNLGISLLMQSLNDTIDLSLEQLQALTSHVPTAVVVLTLALVTLGTLSLGLHFAMSQSRPAVLSAIYVIAYVLVISLMVDYDRPNTGFVRVSLTPLKLQLESMQRSR
ncbi:MAG TPA: hypothetical protein VMT95_02040 [Candidatus Binatia bacterium]|nr:hypothetical protein [Candidatus Binatia bacterium]